MSSLDPEAPEADALEQAQSVAPNGDADEPTTGLLPMPKVPIEASEADVLDQAREVPTGDEDWRD